MSEANSAATPAVSAESTAANEVLSQAEGLETSGAVEGEDVTSQGDVEDAIEEAQQEIQKELKKRLKIKVDGQEIEEEIDFNDEEGLRKKLQLAAAAQKRMQESASLKKDIQSFIETLGKNPKQAISDLGYDFDDIVNKYVEEKLIEMEKSPEQIERERMAKELEELRSEKERLAKEKEQAEMQRLQDQYAAQIDKEIDDALNSSNYSLPKSPIVLKRIAETLLLAMDNGYTNVQVKDVLPIVEKQFLSELHEMYGRVPDDRLETLIGKQNSERLRKQRLAKAKSAKKTQTANQIAKPTGQSDKTENPFAKKPKVNMRDFFKSLK
jgi:hypothetical protein